MHYKHDPAGEPYNYMYEVIGSARHTEDETFIVLYRPLYGNEWFAPADYFARPADMFGEDVQVNGVTKPRFERITKPELIAELQKVQKERLTFLQ